MHNNNGDDYDDDGSNVNAADDEVDEQADNIAKWEKPQTDMSMTINMRQRVT